MIGDKFLSNTDAYSISKTLDMELNADAKTQKELHSQLQYFKQMNEISCRKNKLIPDSVYAKW